MTDREKQIFLQFSSLFQEFSNSVEEAMHHPTPENGYHLHRMHERTAMAWVQFVETVAHEEADSKLEKPKKEWEN